MPRSVTFGEFSLKLGGFIAELPRSQAAATAKAALHVTSGVRDAVRADSGGDMRLSGVGRSGARVGARFDIKGVANPVALIRATGPMQLLERGARPHPIVVRGAPGGRRRSRGARALRTPYGPRRSVSHPGAPAKHTWSHAVDAAVGDVPKIYRDALRKQLTKYFG